MILVNVYCILNIWIKFDQFLQVNFSVISHFSAYIIFHKLQFKFYHYALSKIEFHASIIW